MRVLVAHASKHGSTAAIAREIGTIISTAGHEVTVLPVERITSILQFDAILIGSAVYCGHWLPQGSQFVRENRDVLCARPVWLFSSGPIGDPLKPDDGSLSISELSDMVFPRGHAIFGGALVKERLSLAERLIAKVVKAPAGDFRDWPKIDSWAKQVASSLDSLNVDSVP